MDKDIEKAKEELENAINNPSSLEVVLNKSKQIDKLMFEFLNKKLEGENTNTKNCI